MTRFHTALALALITLIPTAPLTLWLYARAASADRGPAVRANERVLRTLQQMPGARRSSAHSYPVARWGHEGSLVPTSGYLTEFFFRLPGRTVAGTIVAHYRGQLHGWDEHRAGDFAVFERRGTTITVAAIGRRVEEYGVYVSQ